MNAKLTLMLDKEVIEIAKVYAKSHHTSLSKMVENFLANIDKEHKNVEVGPLTKALSGGLNFPENTVDLKEYVRSLKAMENG